MRFFLFMVLAGCAADAATPPAGGYSPDKFAAAAYAKAKAAKADVAPDPVSGQAAAIAAGKAIFDGKCVACHGPAGHGDGPAAVALDPHPADFTDKARREFSTEGTRHWVVLNGIQGTGMAALGLSDADAWNVVAYITTLSQ